MIPSSQTPIRLSISGVIHIITCSGILLFFVVFALRPRFAEYTTLQQHLRALQCQVAVHTALLPLHLELVSTLAAPRSDLLPAESLVPLETHEFRGINSQLQHMAERCGLTLLRATSRASELSSSRHYLGVNVTAEGDFIDMRAFVLALLETPSFFHLEHLHISEALNGEQIEVLVWLAVK